MAPKKAPAAAVAAATEPELAVKEQQQPPAKTARKGAKKATEQPQPAPAVVEATPPAPVASGDAAPQRTYRKARMPRALKEEVVGKLDAVTELLTFLAKPPRKFPQERAEEIAAMKALPPKEIAKQAIEMIKGVRACLRVRNNKADGAERKPSEFNLFVRETMKQLKADGAVFANTTQRMQECGRLWKLRKEALLQQQQA